MRNTYPDLDPVTMRQVFAHAPSGVAAIAATCGDDDVVVVASSFTVGVSLDPPLVMFAVQRNSQSWPKLRAARRLGVSMLSGEQGGLCRQLASSDRAARFAGVDVERGDEDVLLLGGSSVRFLCSVYAEYPAGDHDIVVLQVHEALAELERDPLVFHGSRFRDLA